MELISAEVGSRRKRGSERPPPGGATRSRENTHSLYGTGMGRYSHEPNPSSERGKLTIFRNANETKGRIRYCCRSCRSSTRGRQAHHGSTCSCTSLPACYQTVFLIRSRYERSELSPKHFVDSLLLAVPLIRLSTQNPLEVLIQLENLKLLRKHVSTKNVVVQPGRILEQPSCSRKFRVGERNVTGGSVLGSMFTRYACLLFLNVVLLDGG